MSGYDKSEDYGGPPFRWRELVLFIVVLVVLSGVTAAFAKSENEYQATLCADFERSVFLQAYGTEVDCRSPDLAIELDFSQKWAEAIGQAMHYATALDTKIGIILVCKAGTEPETCTRHTYIAEETLSHWGLSADMWLCPSDAVNRDDCSFVQVRP